MQISELHQERSKAVGPETQCCDVKDAHAHMSSQKTEGSIFETSGHDGWF